MTDFSYQNLYNYLLLNHPTRLKYMLQSAIYLKYDNEPIIDICDPRFYEYYFIKEPHILHREIIELICDQSIEPQKTIDMIRLNLIPIEILDRITEDYKFIGIELHIIIDLKLSGFMPKNIYLIDILYLPHQEFIDTIDIFVENKFEFIIPDSYSEIFFQEKSNNIEYFINRYLQNDNFIISRKQKDELMVLAYVYCDINLLINIYTNITSEYRTKLKNFGRNVNTTFYQKIYWFNYPKYSNMRRRFLFDKIIFIIQNNIQFGVDSSELTDIIKIFISRVFNNNGNLLDNESMELFFDTLIYSKLSIDCNEIIDYIIQMSEFYGETELNISDNFIDYIIQRINKLHLDGNYLNSFQKTIIEKAISNNHTIMIKFHTLDNIDILSYILELLEHHDKIKITCDNIKYIDLTNMTNEGEEKKLFDIYKIFIQKHLIA